MLGSFINLSTLDAISCTGSASVFPIVLKRPILIKCSRVTQPDSDGSQCDTMIHRPQAISGRLRFPENENQRWPPRLESGRVARPEQCDGRGERGEDVEISTDCNIVTTHFEYSASCQPNAHSCTLKLFHPFFCPPSLPNPCLKSNAVPPAGWYG